ncbi:unnamed protein product [Ectocarpus sp. CCAP 1310/34]|nr:unnamed protein product [Ectocarpus sp. CCAP 1310/34]
MNPRRPPRGRYRRGTSAYIMSTRQERTRENNRVREMQRRYKQRRRVDDMVIDDDYVHGGSSSDEVERITFNREIPTAAISDNRRPRNVQSVNLMTPLRAETLLKGLQDFRDHMFAGSTRLTLVRRHHVISASEIPNKQLLRADEALRKHERVMATFRGYAGDTERELGTLVLSKFGIESEEPYKIHKATFVERAAAYPIRTKGHVVALESRRVNNIPGTAKRSMRGTSVFYANNSSSVATELPLAATGLLDMITVVLAGKKKPKTSDLGRLLGARKSMIRDIIDYMLDKEEKLVVGFPLGKSLPISEENLDSYSENGAIPKVLLDSILTSNDPLNVHARVSSTYTRSSDEIGTEKVTGVGVFLALVPDNSKEQSVVYRPQRLIVTAEW